MAALAASASAVAAIIGFGRAAVCGSVPALAVGVVDAAAAGLCWLAGRVL